ncbi:hypothetical protein HY612_04620 [Candidatus Roizmanbacteria bacterium]|nr:hypothetical protein [Candidatus Roizmanbacteria bacterium]
MRRIYYSLNLYSIRFVDFIDDALYALLEIFKKSGEFLHNPTSAGIIFSAIYCLGIFFLLFHLAKKNLSPLSPLDKKHFKIPKTYTNYIKQI